MSTSDELNEIAYEIFLRDYADKNPQQFVIPLEPVPASRPRVFGNGGVTYGKNYNAFRECAVGPCNSFTGARIETECTKIACLVEHVVSYNPKFPFYPNGDLDNYDKGPLDAMVKSKLFWVDDIQITFMISIKRYVKPLEEACVNVTWFGFED